MDGILSFSAILSTFAEAIMFFMLFEAFLKRRKECPFWGFIAGIAGLTLALLICNHFLLYTLLNAVGAMVIALAFSLLYQGSIPLRLLAAAITIVISGICENLALYSIVLSAPLMPSTYQNTNY